MAIYNFFFLLIFEDTCGWKSAFLVNKLFIYYSPKSSIYYRNVFFFYVDHFKLLAIKSMEKQKQWCPVFGMVRRHITAFFDLGFVLPYGTRGVLAS